MAAPISRPASLDSFDCLRALPGFPGLRFFSLALLAQRYPALRRWPVVKLVLLENLLRHEDGVLLDQTLIARFIEADGAGPDLPFYPARVLMQDYAGISALVDFAGLRNYLEDHGIAPDSIAPATPVDLVVDHSLQVNAYGSHDAARLNLRDEYKLNKSRYEFLRWAQQSIDNLRIIPPGRGIVHQVNVEVLSTGTRVNDGMVFFDTLVGTDSHTPMVNGLGILGWGVGGIEALAVMLGQPVWLAAPRVLGIRLSGHLPAGVYAADIALTLTAFLRGIGVVGAFLEFFGPGCEALSVFDKTTIANMTPEYGATCSLFPATESTLAYFEGSPRSDVAGESAAALRAYLMAQNLLGAGVEGGARAFDALHEFDLGRVQISFAGPSRPDQLHPIAALRSALAPLLARAGAAPQAGDGDDSDDGRLSDGVIAIAAITSCTNTAHPKSMIAAGLVARKAVALGLRVAPHVKCSLTPGSLAVDRYLRHAGLLAPLETLGFHLAGYGCATCVGNSGDLTPQVQAAVERHQPVLASVLSGNRNFESRVHPAIAANFLMAPALVVALALAGTVNLDPQRDPIATTPDGKSVYLADLLPAPQLVEEIFAGLAASGLTAAGRADTFAPSAEWDALEAGASPTFPWKNNDSYFKRPTVLDDLLRFKSDSLTLPRMKALLVLGDDITTDHISPVGRIGAESAAARLLSDEGETAAGFNSYGARRGNAGVMLRGTFDNPRLNNALADRPGPYTVLGRGQAVVPVFEAAQALMAQGVGAVIIAGKNYGTGSARDWAAKGQRLLGVGAVIAESFERIHRANLIMFGVAPLLLGAAGMDALRALVDADSVISVSLAYGHRRQRPGAVIAVDNGGAVFCFEAVLQTDTVYEYTLLAAGGLLASLKMISHST